MGIGIDEDTLFQYSFMRDKAAGRTVPNLWKGRDETSWRADDGRVFGAMTRAPDVKSFRYFTDVKHVHPDAAFAPADLPEQLQPGATFNCCGRVWMLCNGARKRAGGTKDGQAYFGVKSGEK